MMRLPSATSAKGLDVAFLGIPIDHGTSALPGTWLRRPACALRLVAPPRPQTVPLTGGVMLAALLLSMAFPMLGLTLLAILALDLVILSALPGLKRALS